MTFYRKPTLLIVSAMFLACPMAASAQISLGEDYRGAADEIREYGVGEDYVNQKRDAEEQNVSDARVLSRNANSSAQKAMKALQKSDYKKAITQIDKGFSAAGLTDYDQSVLYQLRAAATLKQGDHAGAISSYEKAIATGGMTETEIQAVQTNLVKLRQAAG